MYRLKGAIMGTRGHNRMRMVIALVVGVLLLTMGRSAMAFSGAIFTSTGDGAPVNLNHYRDCTDVYLNGGPQGQSSNGLPDGTYYFQVTDPNGGTLLSTDAAACRQLVVSNERVAGVPTSTPAGCTDAGGALHANGVFNSANGSTPVQLAPFGTTPNVGKEYKVWLIAQTSATIDESDPKVIIFNHNDSKTDNFKVENACNGGGGGGGGGDPETSTISGFKFYDANVNGYFDFDEFGISGWKIFIFGGPESFDTTTDSTDLAGEYSFINLEDGTYGVCEVIPSLAPVWVPTTSTQITGIAVPPDSDEHNFGNVCLGPGGGKTLGFWSNKNGKAVMNDGGTLAPELALLSGLCLRNAIGNDVNPSDYSSFKSWILKATATNMAYMLSAQLAAMELNVESGQVADSAVVYAPGCGDSTLNSTGNFITINGLMATANTQLCINAITLAGNPERSDQECLKNALDAGNNNRNFVQATACEVNYSNTEASCVP